MSHEVDHLLVVYIEADRPLADEVAKWKTVPLAEEAAKRKTMNLFVEEEAKGMKMNPPVEEEAKWKKTNPPEAPLVVVVRLDDAPPWMPAALPPQIAVREQVPRLQLEHVANLDGVLPYPIPVLPREQRPRPNKNVAHPNAELR